MELTGKCKEDFEKWFKEFHPFFELDSSEWYEDEKYWDDLDDSMQYGVYVDFFDSVGSEVYITNGLFDIEIRQNRTLIDRSWGEVATRHEARTKAIEKVNEIYNSNNK